MKYALLSLVISICVLGSAPTATAAECVGESFPDTVTVGGDTLTLNGLGLREATVFSVDVYVAALYVTKKSSSGPALIDADAKKRFVMRFVRDVEASKIQDAVREGIEKSKYGPGPGLRAKAKQLVGWMSKSVVEGDTYTFTYAPGDGLTVEFNGKTLGTIPGATFARAVFDTWIGENPPNEGLKTGLLGGSCG